MFFLRLNIEFLFFFIKFRNYQIYAAIRFIFILSSICIRNPHIREPPRTLSPRSGGHLVF